jgi:hypothetical protein
MTLETIQRLRQQYTDQYVVVDASRPELVRFKGMTGQVKTVNMNGRALVQFDGTGDRGWYDIAPEFLTIVDKPPPAEKTALKTPKPTDRVVPKSTAS